ncbi:MAG: N-acetyltransferase [Saprospiraceae bacterium]|nr:N-acetyltransferase [Saprospiraceae bacterium]
MEIQHYDNDGRGRWFIETDGETLGEMTYFWNIPEVFTIDHTEVGEKLKGTGSGKKLVKAAVEYARQNDLKIRATCPFAKSVLSAEELADVVA